MKKAALFSVLLASLWAVPSWCNEEPSMIIDVRTPAEWAEGHLESAIHLELNVFVEGIAAIAPDKEQQIYLYCRSGNRSGQAKDYMTQIGYTNVTNAGGYEEAAKLLSEAIVK
ncbi:MAG: rhodanese-like domain-containing protein [Porticoccaceae bacterium]